MPGTIEHEKQMFLGQGFRCQIFMSPCRILQYKIRVFSDVFQVFVARYCRTLPTFKNQNSIFRSLVFEMKDQKPPLSHKCTATKKRRPNPAIAPSDCFFLLYMMFSRKSSRMHPF